MGVKDIKKYGDKDTHTWRWWVWRRVVTRLLVQPANTGQENDGDKVEEEKVENINEEEYLRRMFGKEGASKRFSDDSGCGGQISGWQGSYFGSTTSLLLLLQPIKQKLKLILCADFL